MDNSLEFADSNMDNHGCTKTTLPSSGFRNLGETLGVEYCSTSLTGRRSRTIHFNFTTRTFHLLVLCFIFLHCSFLIPNAEARSSRNQVYRWKTGDWGVCTSESCGKTGVQYRYVYCAYGSRDRIVSRSKCNASTKPPHGRTCIEKCEESHLSRRRRKVRPRRNSRAQWEIGPWEECQNTVCGEGGVQLRKVDCVYIDRSWTVTHNECNITAKPIDERPCFKVCDIHRDQYVWKSSEWDECKQVDTLPATKRMKDKCGLDFVAVGSQFRNIACVEVRNSSKTIDDYVCESFTPQPIKNRSCDVPCPINCATTHWGPWSECSRTCGNGTQHRTRSVLTTAKYGGQKCPTLSSTRPCREQPCDPLLETFFSHIFKFGNWSACSDGRLEISRGGGRNRKNKKEIRKLLEEVDKTLVGGRERDISCYDDGIKLGNRIIMKETCLITKNCEVSDWTEWSICSARCGRRGNRTRTREVTQLPTGPGARECPTTEEIEGCDVSSHRVKNCDEYTWVTGGWDECKTLDIENATCGGGTRKRYVYCVVRNEFTIYKASSAVAKSGKERLKDWAKMQPVDETYCDEKYKPSTWEECNVLCLAMCEVGKWSDWSECAPEKCSEDPEGPEIVQINKGRRKNAFSGFKQRVRKILDSINGEEGCPHTKEFIPCDESRCFRWHVDSQSSCVPYRGKCGRGEMVRNVVCQNMWGTEVDERLCRRTPAAPMINSTEPCYVACSSDCVVGEWSNWTPCTNDCKRGRRESGQQIRYREILANPGPGGRSCPAVSELEESRSCNQHRCSVYHWDIGSWGECLVKNSVTPSPPAIGIRTSDMFMSDDGNSTRGHHAAFYFPPEEEKQVCGKGYQIRDVRCRKKDSDHVNNKLCGKHRPVITRDCTFPCPKDCVVSEWGEWSDCERECEKSQKGASGLIYQYRQRVVIQHRTGRGTPCSVEMKQRRICKESEKCMAFRWHTTKWSECAKISGTNSIFQAITSDEELKCLGAMTRNVSCRYISMSGEVKVAETRLCYKHAGYPPPEAARRCLIKCKQDRNFKNWMDRNRCRAVLRNLESTEEILGFPVMSYSNTSYITMQKTAKPIGEWSSCNITKANRQQISPLLRTNEPYCGTGYRQRALACYIEGTDIVVDNSHCQYREFQRESCEIPCPVDCQMSKWRRWGNCGEVSIGGGGTQESGLAHSSGNASNSSSLPCGNHLAMRHRYRLEEPQHGGRACPALDSLTLEYESKLCHSFCDVDFWIPKPWSKCEINRNGAFSNCGKGSQTRSVTCYGTDRGSGYSDVAKIHTDIRICDLDTMPFGYRTCNYPCPGECVYSEWSSWQNCKAANGDDPCSGIRKRTRKVLRQVAPQTGRKSPKSGRRPKRLPASHCDNPRKTIEEEGCTLNENCFTYSTMWTSWSSCKVPSGAKCGVGVKRRRSNCISSSGLPVYEDRCTKHNVSIPAPEHSECQVICAIDCKVSQWTDWSTCSGECGDITYRKRSRKIIREPSILGRPCPVTVETTPCPPKPCHSWMLGDWSECLIPGDNCGTGLKIREVKCIQKGLAHSNSSGNASRGIAVGSSLCQNEQGDLDMWFKDSDLRQDCEVPCSGECLRTDWSTWSDCHLRCVTESTPISGLKAGVQTRSRVGFMLGQLENNDCPQEEVEEKPCDLGDGKCYIYEWKTTPKFHNGRRPVWCQRTIDGMNVSTGCDDRIKLQEELYCSQNCEKIKHAFCGENGICECNKQFSARTLPTGKLVACENPPPNDDSQTGQDMNEIIRKVESQTSTKLSTSQKSTTTEEPKSTKKTKVNKASGFLDNLGVFTEAGQLKVWVYGAIAGLAVFIIFIIASIYLICVACRKKKPPQNYGLYSTKNLKNSKFRKDRHKRRHNSSGSNIGVGMVIGAGGPRFPPSNSAMSHTSSTSRSGYSYRDNEDIPWKET